MSGEPEAVRQQRSFSDLERVKREDANRRYRETTPGERVDSALRMSQLTAELRSGLKTRSG